MFKHNRGIIPLDHWATYFFRNVRDRRASIMGADGTKLLFLVQCAGLECNLCIDTRPPSPCPAPSPSPASSPSKPNQGHYNPDGGALVFIVRGRVV